MQIWALECDMWWRPHDLSDHWYKEDERHLKQIWPQFTVSWLSGKESTCQCRRCRFDPWVGKIPWRRKWQSTSVFLPEEPHGQRCLVAYSPWGHKETDMTKHIWPHSLEPMVRIWRLKSILSLLIVFNSLMWKHRNTWLSLPSTEFWDILLCGTAVAWLTNTDDLGFLSNGSPTQHYWVSGPYILYLINQPTLPTLQSRTRLWNPCWFDSVTSFPDNFCTPWWMGLVNPSLETRPMGYWIRKSESPSLHHFSPTSLLPIKPCNSEYLWAMSNSKFIWGMDPWRVPCGKSYSPNANDVIEVEDDRSRPNQRRTFPLGNSEPWCIECLAVFVTNTTSLFFLWKQ